ncbi:MAG: GNAT family N-acetyltransferase [Myxococcota bacterium]
MALTGDRLPEVRAQRVALRWLTAADTDDIFRIYSDPEVMAYWSTVPMKERAQAGELIASVHRLYAEHSLYEWGVVRLEDERTIGTLTLASIDTSNKRTEIGFALARDAWGQGFMREAVTAGIDFAFDTLGLQRIEADVDPDNAASLRLLDTLGFVREGLLRERWRVGGGVQDSVMLGLLRREWTARDRG